MMSLSSFGEVLGAVRRSHDVTLIAYTLPHGRLLAALADAARNGATVRVRLEGDVYKDDGGIGKSNRAAVGRLRAAGADARLVHESDRDGEPMLHAKAMVADGVTFLDDRNWPDDGDDTIVRDDFTSDAEMVRDAARGREDVASPYFAIEKRRALASETRLLNEAKHGDEVIVESESFGAGNGVYRALERLARSGVRERILVNARDLAGNGRERAAIARLKRAGATVRVTDSDEKFAVVRGERGWIGSANATPAWGNPDQIDWGARTDAPTIIAHVREKFEERWATASRVPP